MEHLQHFGLSQDPFQNEPDLRFYFESASHSNVQLRVERGLRQHKGLTVLTGESGAGKTLVTRRIFENLEDEVFEASLMVVLPGAADAGTILTRFARQLGVEDPAMEDRSVLLGQIYEKMAIVREDGRHSLLIIDDAHVLSSEAIAEVGGLLNLEYEDRRLLSMLWVGSSELDLTLAHHPGVAQRVEVRALLEPLDPENSAAYVHRRLQVAGGRPEIVPEETQASLCKFSRGRPRLLNILTDNGLFEAYLAGRAHLEVSDVEHAAAELGIGPDPGSTYTERPDAAPAHGAAAAAMAGLGDPSPDLVGGSDASASGSPNADDSLLSALSGDSSEAEIASLFETDGRTEPVDELGDLLSDSSGGDQLGLDTGLETDVGVELGSAEIDPDLGSLIDEAPPVRDLDTHLDGAAEATRIALPEEDIEIEPLDEMELDEASLAPGEAEATRIALPDEEISFADSLGESEAPLAQSDSTPKQGSDEIDDLFVELIDD